MKWLLPFTLVLAVSLSTGCATNDAQWDRLNDQLERLERGTSELEQGLQAGPLKDDVRDVKEAIEVVKEAVKDVKAAESNEAKIAAALKVLEEQKDNIPYGDTVVPIAAALAAMFGLNAHRNNTREKRLAQIKKESNGV